MPSGAVSKIRRKGRVLLIALVVGLLLSNNMASAQAPLMKTQFSMSVKALAQFHAAKQWGNPEEFKCLNQLVHHESRWNPKALNKSSGAYGLFQFLPTTWKNYKYPYRPKDPEIQIKAGLRYIFKRYKTPCKAWAFWQKQAHKGKPWY